MPPESASPLRDALQHLRRRRDRSRFEGKFRVDIQQGLATWPRPRRNRQPGDHHGVALIVVANERKTSVSPGLGEPRIPLRQEKHLVIIRNGPLQAQTGERAFHGMDNGHGAAVIAQERRRMDFDTKGILRHRHFSTTA
jgi:hypothetical protein